jgi:RP/EB family microtubule-associated protein
MNKLNWSATQDFEYVSNYKILQSCFTKLHIDRFIDVDRLISGKYMDNLEFMQWFKRYYELNCADKGNLCICMYIYVYEHMYMYVYD